MEHANSEIDVGKKHVSPKEYRKTIRCKFNEEGTCRKGNWCEFKHLRNIPCVHFQRGNCMRGDMCTFRHIEQEINPKQEKNINKNNKKPMENNKEQANKSDIPQEQKIPQQKETVETDKQQKQNFHKDKRLMEQILTSEEFQKTLETMIGKAIEKVTKGNM